ncbi:MAG: response regulator [Methylocystaceae bacterium]|nr:response regulator [Methylocystaceae bacterium]
MTPKNILIIDDEELVRDAIMMVLMRNGFVVSATGSANEGLKLIETNKFDLIITDLVMPEIDGVTFIKLVRQKIDHIPIMTLTGGARPGQKNMNDKAKAAGAIVTLQKPLSKKELLAGIDLAFKAAP